MDKSPDYDSTDQVILITFALMADINNTVASITNIIILILTIRFKAGKGGRQGDIKTKLY